MENPKIAFKEIISDDSASNYKVRCSKCGGSGNFKTQENFRRTCLVCFGKGYLNGWYILNNYSKNICLLINSPFYLNLN